MGFTGVTKKITLLIEFFHLLYTEPRFSDPLWNSPLLRQSPKHPPSVSLLIEVFEIHHTSSGTWRQCEKQQIPGIFDLFPVHWTYPRRPNTSSEGAWNIFWGVQKPSQEVFGCLGLLPSLPVIPHVRISVSLDFLSHLLKPSGLFGVPNSLTPPHQVWLYNLYMNDG